MTWSDPEKRKQYLREWKIKNPDRVRSYRSNEKKPDPEQTRLRNRRYRERNLESLRERDKIKQRERRILMPEKYQATKSKSAKKRRERYEQKAGRQAPSVCEVCGEFHRYICFDHCHATNRFRGWLCDRCNKVLGLVYDKGETLRLLADYLEKFK